MVQATQRAERAPAVSRRRSGSRLNALVPYAFIGPAMLIVLLLVFAPALANIAFSLQNGHLTSPLQDSFVGLDNYRDILSDPDMYIALGRSLSYALVMAILAPLVGLGWALLLNETFPLRGVYRVLMMTPWILSGILVGRIWNWLVDPHFGYLTHLVQAFILTPLGRGNQELVWLGDPLGAWSVVILASTWGRYPFAFLMFLAGLQSIPRELYEAAMVDGAGRVQRFWYITVPRLWFISLIVGLLTFIGSFNDFGTILVMTQGGPADATMVLSYVIYQTLTLYLRFGKGAALAVLVVAFLAVSSTLYLMLLRRRSAEEV